ncbi:MAG: sugar ABC transporter permease [Candidatus Hydrogenedentes bacterium]|nr:sugar ABC transporter permease [Candidatus Hydrogenedentota bacterium]
MAIALDRVLSFIDNVFDAIRGRRSRDAVIAGVLLSPTLLILGVFGIYPLGYAVYLSLRNVRDDVFIGAANYARAWHDPEFWRSLTVTIYYALGTIPLTMLFSFIVAMMLFRLGRGRGLFRTLYFLPYVTSVVAVATVWRILLRTQSGFINSLLISIGLSPQAWLTEPRGVLHLLTGGYVPPTVGPSLALSCVIVFDIWHASGFMIVIFLAGLTAIPRELEEAAIIDGASRWQVTRSIIFPLLSPTFFFLSVVGAIKAFQSFNSFYALTNTARSEDTQNLVVYIFAQLYEMNNYGYGAAIAVLMCIGIVALTLIQWRLIGRRVHYG